MKFKYYYFNFNKSSLNFRVHLLNFKIRPKNLNFIFFISKNILNNKFEYIFEF